MSEWVVAEQSQELPRRGTKRKKILSVVVGEGKRRTRVNSSLEGRKELEEV